MIDFRGQLAWFALWKISWTKYKDSCIDLKSSNYSQIDRLVSAPATLNSISHGIWSFQGCGNLQHNTLTPFSLNMFSNIPFSKVPLIDFYLLKILGTGWVHEGLDGGQEKLNIQESKRIYIQAGILFQVFNNWK
ncbi:hypothetical protein FRX31_033059 [Thalictrum thalictroides]|uniref:Uncharacterized protein n=1 Tax=Thalictrum thalictroides TaxID=46969 RepID=A0A7J6UYU4_THATH|nr:hypothetical protein FRX31_033059 [Thalictrum thalictroides]